MDKSIPKGIRQGNGHRTSPIPFLAFSQYSSRISLQDKTFEFEKRRNVPIKYSRDLVQTTLQAMKRIAEIKARRERAFWKNRYVPFHPFLFPHHTHPSFASQNVRKQSPQTHPPNIRNHPPHQPRPASRHFEHKRRNHAPRRTCRRS